MVNDLKRGWQLVKFGTVIAESQPGFASGQRDPNGVIQLRMNNVDTRGHLLWNEFIRVPADQATIEKYRLKPDDIVFNNTNSAELVGKSALFNNHKETVVYSNHFTRLRVKPQIADANFVTHWLISQWQAKTFEKICNRWIGQSAVKTDRLFVLEIPLPPLDEQRRIAGHLNEQLAAVESARKAAEEQLHVAWQLPSAYLMGVFESEQAKNWNSDKLGNVSEIVGGVQKTPDRVPTNFHKPYLTVRNVQQGYLDLSQVERFEVTPSEFERCRLRSGDILIVEGNGSIDQIGRNALFELGGDDWIHQNHIIRVRLPKDKFNPKFVSSFLNSPLGRLQMVDKAKTTSGLYTLSSGKVASLEIPSPTLDMQQKLVQDLDAKLVNVYNIQASLESQLAEINRLPASLLRDAFMGS
jgi:type I restriction enzyme, S subunit